MNYIGIKHITSCTADCEISAEELTSRYNVDSNFINNKTGFLKLYRQSNIGDTLALAKKSINSFKESSDSNFDKIDLVVCVTQNPGRVKMPHLAAFIQDYIAPNRYIPSFDISLGCSGWVYALDIVKSFMSSNALHNALLITCDPYSQVIDENDKNTSLLFSDGASVTLISDEDPVWLLKKGSYGTDGSRYQSIYCNTGNRLEMNGRSLFETVVKSIPKVIDKVVKHNCLQISDIDKYVMHQGSKYMVDYIASIMGLTDKMPFAASSIGNTVSSSIPSVFDKIVCADDKIICVCSFGIGFSWACNILKRI